MTQATPFSRQDIAFHPLTAAQLEIWLDQMLQGAVPLYNIGGYVRIEGVLDPQRLEQAVNLVIGRHDALRTVLVPGLSDAHLPRQRFMEALDFQMPVHDVSQQDNPEAAAQALMQANLRQPFELEGRPLFRMELLKVREDACYFFMNCHHLIADGWAVAMISRAVGQAYTALEQNREIPATAPAYVDYIRQGKARRASDQLQRQYWLDKYRTLPEPLLPARYRDRLEHNVSPSRNHAWRLPRELYDRLNALAKTSSRSNAFHVILGALYTYFARVTQRDELVFGVPILNRANAVQKATLGLFAGMSPVRLSLGHALGFDELVRNIAQVLKQDYRHQRFPLSELNRELELQRTGRRQLFDVVVSYEIADQELWFGQSRGHPVKLCNGFEQTPLSVHIRESAPGDDVWMHLIYNQAYFDGAEIEALQQRIMSILQSVLENFSRPVSTLSLLSATEHEQVDKWNHTAVEYPDDPLLHTLIEAQAAARPDAIAVRFENQVLTYGELNRQANRLAHSLLALGIRPDERVALCVERSLEMVVGLLGILKAGGAYVPLDPGYPADRLAHMLSDSTPRALLTTTTLLATLPEASMPVLRLDADREIFSSSPDSNPDASALGLTARHLAYVIYTSGSTGLPKGVMNQHDGVVNRLRWAQQTYGVDHDSRILQKTPFSFDVSVWEFFLPLLAGAQLVVAAPGGHQDPHYLTDIMAGAEITMLHFVPSMLQLFLDQADPDRLPCLRQVLCSGEALPYALQERFFERLPGVQLHNLYGPTEAAIDVSAWHCRPDVHEGITPIGKPIANMQMHILDTHLQPMPPGVEGEIYLGGIGVARGYLNQAELTVERFLDHPLGSAGPKRLYKTGDLGRWLPDGSVQYLGRNDFQIKIRGLRIELGEIESRLRACEGVKDVVVAASHDDDGDTSLIAYLLSDEGCVLEHSTLRTELRRHVPDYMVPRHCIELERFPLNVNGKLDRKALPVPDAVSGGEAAVEPRNELERTLVELFQENLKCDSIGIHDNYFMLGGDSLKVIRLKVKARERNIPLNLEDVYQHPDIAQLARHLETQDSVATDADSFERALPFSLVAPDIRRINQPVFDDMFPASQLQVGMIYHSMMHPDSAIYHDIFRYTLRLKWDAAAWQQACEALIRRHPALRMSFDMAHAGQPMARIHKRIRPPVRTVDVRGLTPEERQRLIAAHVEERKRLRTDWKRPPLYLFCVFAAQDEIDLVFSFHHAILDGWSVATLMRDLLALYTDRSATLPLLTTSAADFARLEQQAIANQSHSAFWKGYLENAPAAALVNWAYCVAPDTVTHRTLYREIPARKAADLEAFCQRHALPLRTVLLAAHGVAHSILSGQEEILCGVIGHGRPEFDDTESLLGLFLNTLPLRFDRRADSWLGMIEALMEQERQIHAHRRYPFALIHRQTGVSLHGVFNYVDFYVLDQAREQDEPVLAHWETTEASNYDLLTTVGRHPVNGSLLLKMDYQTARVATSQAQLYAEYVVRVLEAMVAAPKSAPVIPVRPATDSSPPAMGSVPSVLACDNLSSLLQDAFSRGGEQIALSAGDTRLSYAHVAEASARIADWLHRQGIGKGDRVALMLPRSPDLVIALLGILQAGAAYVPIDLGYPQERIQLILDDSQPRLVLIDETVAERIDTRPACTWKTLTEQLSDDRRGCRRQVASIAADLSGQDLAYLLYTSGSTGRPKGVAMPHRALVNMVLWQTRQDLPAPKACGQQKTLQYAPISFDVSFQEIVSTLICGGELVMIDESLRYDFIRLLKFIRTQEINRLFLPYVAFQGLAEVASQLDLRPASLRQINVAGEALKITDEIRNLIDGIGQCVVENHYGPTETHVVTHLRLEGPAASWPSLPPIGKAIDGVRVHILDSAGQRCLAGVAGDLYIEGICLANGYWNQPALTEERFVVRTLDGQPRRMYLTGDIGFCLPSGDVVYLGRSDTQVKIRGYRVEPGEVEMALLRANHQGVDIQQVAVVDRQAPDGQSFLVGFIQVAPAQVLDLERLKAGMRSLLPAYMLPASLVIIDRMPLGPTGKIDRNRLRQMEVQVTRKRSFTAPGNPEEQLLQACWQKTLGIEDIGVHDDFFEIGGNSLMAVRLIAMLAKEHGLEPPLSDFIQAPTIAEFARVLQRIDSEPHDTGVLVDFRNAEQAPALFLIHPIGGHVLCYAALARAMRDKVRLYALQSPGTWDAREPLQSVQAQAAYYADAIEAVMPQGPLNVGGWSYGGVVAYELARELRKRGRELQNVFLLDTIVRLSKGKVEIDPGDFLNWFMWELLSGDGQREYDYEALEFATLSESQALEAIRQHGVDKGIFDASMTLLALERIYRVFHANWQALVDYEFPPLNLPLTLFAADTELPEVLLAPHELVGTAFRDPYRGWLSVSDKVERIAVQGNHLTMMRLPHIEYVGSTIATRLKRSLPRTGAPKVELA